MGQAVGTVFATDVLRLFVWYLQATLQARRVFVKTLNNARKNASGSGVFPLAFFESVQQFVFCNRQVAVGQAVDTGFATGVLRHFVWYLQATLQVRTGLCENSEQCLKNASGSGIFPLAFFCEGTATCVLQQASCSRTSFFEKQSKQKHPKILGAFFVAKCVSLHKFVQPYVKKRCYLTYQLS